MTSNCTLSKGKYFVTIQSTKVSLDTVNELKILTIPQTKQNQSSGPQDPIVVDLVRITNTYTIRGEITGSDTAINDFDDHGGALTITAEQIKNNLLSIYEGADINGGTVSFNYSGLKSNPATGYIQKLKIEETSMDLPSSINSDVIKYTVIITFVRGVGL